ncbi:hypothetical protein GLOIN_2v1789077 [Rhizophagus clarus]|uniref:Uncharacterized protein n=1 Tax=Rhizophagus clarus TaxID=94130 RepID=A0A8H3QML4_9GLOM|nr:hypothetical protein GLOIN_2v1789077 [Rhizophagus clarus]
MTPEQQREQFIRGLNPMNQYNIRIMAKFYDTQDNITKALAEAEKYTLSQNSAPSSFPIFPSANPYVDTNRSGSGMTKNEIEELIKTTMASSQPQQNTDLQAIAKSFQETMSRATKTLDNNSDESSLEEESLDDPMEIDFVKKKEPKMSVATIKCKIRCLKIPAMTLDSGAEPPIITKNIIDRTKDKIDKSEKHDLSGVATVPIESIGIVRNLPITLAPGNMDAQWIGIQMS